jgi:hypothetical protein
MANSDVNRAANDQDMQQLACGQLTQESSTGGGEASDSYCISSVRLWETRRIRTNLCQELSLKGRRVM